MGVKQENIQQALTETRVMEWISKGKSRQYCITQLQEEGMTRSVADHMYYGALKKLLPDPDLFTAYKQSLAQQNIDRLESIVESSISGTTGDKAIAIKAIDTLNKMISAYGDNGITIAQQDKDGAQQVIKIVFEK